MTTICGRERPPFKLIPRYVDLFLYRTRDGGYLCHRRWMSEAYGETPVHFDFVRAKTLDELSDMLLNFDPTALAHTIWPEDSPENARRAKRAKDWLRKQYAGRVKTLIEVARERP